MCGCVRVTCNLYTDDVDASEQCKRRGRVHGSAVPHDSRPSSRYQQTQQAACQHSKRAKWNPPSSLSFFFASPVATPRPPPCRCRPVSASLENHLLTTASSSSAASPCLLDPAAGWLWAMAGGRDRHPTLHFVAHITYVSGCKMTNLL